MRLLGLVPALGPLAVAAARHPLDPAIARFPLLAGIGVGGLLGLAACLLVASFLFYAWVLGLACRLCGEEKPGLGRALGIVALQLLVGIGIGISELLLLGATGIGSAAGPAFQGGQALLGFAANCVVVARMLELGLGKAAAIQLMSLAITVGIAIGLGVLAAFAAGGLGLLHAAG
jgi:hypothetical protein